MKVSKLGVESELQLLAYATATAMPDLSHICDLHQSSWQCWILNPLSKARDQTWILMDTSRVHYRWAAMGAPVRKFLDASVLESKIIHFVLCVHDVK